jgi:RNase P protein component
MRLSDLDIVIMARRQVEMSTNAAVNASLSRHWRSLTQYRESRTGGRQ